MYCGNFEERTRTAKVISKSVLARQGGPASPGAEGAPAGEGRGARCWGAGDVEYGTFSAVLVDHATLIRPSCGSVRDSLMQVCLVPQPAQ